MTRLHHDQLAKQYIAELLKPLGQVETSRDVTSEVRQIDVYFEPSSERGNRRAELGLLGKIASRTCLIEVFRNAPSLVQIRSCKLKLYELHGELIRKARRDKQNLAEEELALLWILSPTLSEAMGAKLGAQQDDDWGEGVYFQPAGEKVALVAINQLPETDQTLWLRILGRGGTQKKAIEELVKLSGSLPLVPDILEILANWRINVEMRQNLDSSEQKELIMNLSPAYLRWREDTLQEGRRDMVENLLAIRFGVLDTSLKSAIPPMLKLPPSELSALLLTLSREEMLARFGEGTPGEG